MSLKEYLKRGLSYMVHGVPVKNVRPVISYLQPDHRLADKKVIITGGGRGLGKAMAIKFMSEGAEVLITGRKEETLKKTSEELGCKYFVFDVQDANAAGDFIKKAESVMPGVNCLVNNAGVSLHEGDIRHVSVEQFNSQMEINLRGGYFLSQQFVKLLEQTHRSGGNILFVSSERGSYVDDLPYGLTKAAVNSLVQGLANRVIGSGIRVNAVAPGVTSSDMTGFKSDGNLYCNYNITERVYLPEEVAEVACFLLSNASNCLSGQILVCNEGKSINVHWR